MKNAVEFSAESDDLVALRDRYLYRALKGKPAEQVLSLSVFSLGTPRDLVEGLRGQTDGDAMRCDILHFPITNYAPKLP